MKRIFKIIFISLVCVIGGLSAAVGIGFLVGSMNQEIVYANDLYFSQTNIVSAETIYLQVNTNTSGVTEKTLKLVPSIGGGDIVEFPETITIGKTFTVVPKRKNGVNRGGNVTLIAEYYSSSSNVSVTAKCDILIDVPVREVNVNFNIEPLTLNETVNVYLKDNEVLSTLNVTPAYSLAPQLAFSEKEIQNVNGKSILLELVNEAGNVVSKETAIFKKDGNEVSNSIFVDYSYRDADGDGYKELVFDTNLDIEAKEQKAEVYLKAYVYPTYKQQNNNIVDGKVVFNNGLYIEGKAGFKVNDYEISNMTMNTSSKIVMFKEEVKVYLKNDNVTGNDINLGINLETDSPGITVQDYYILKNIVIDFEDNSTDNSNLFTISKSNSELCNGKNNFYGYSANFDSASTQTDGWFWIFKVDDFKAYKNYKDNGKPIIATVSYYDDKGTDDIYDDVLYQHSFEIITDIYKADSLSVKYPENKNSFNVRSEDSFKVDEKNMVTINHSLENGNIPTGKDFKSYISYDKNFGNGFTTVDTIPNDRGTYKAKFDIELTKGSDSIILNYLNDIDIISVNFIQNNITQNYYRNNGNTENKIELSAGKVEVEIEFTNDVELKDEIIFLIQASKELFNETISIISSNIKFYEKENATDSDSQYSKFPYLTINNVRYFIDYDFYEDDNNLRYLEIKDTNYENSYKLSGIGSFYITVQNVYNDYWLGVSTDIKIEVYQELNNLVVYNFNGDNFNSFISSENYSTENNILSYSEDDTDKHYIFITSDEIQALTNYVNYGQININFNQVFGELDENIYLGIKEINKNAITFGDTWYAFVDNSTKKIVGFVNYYEINPVYSILIEGTNYLENIFNINISILVDNNEVNAEFVISNEVGNENKVSSLPIKILDKIVTKSVLNIKNGEKESATGHYIVKADLEDGKLVWDTDLNDSLEYNFEYSDQSKTTESMAYDLQHIIDENSSLINVNNLYRFNINNDGNGGFVLKNFPEILDENKINKGVLLKLKIYASDLRDFNSHYEWDAGKGSFVQKINNGLESNIFIRVYGLKIQITPTTNLEVIGSKDNKVELFSREGKDDNNNPIDIVGLFDLNVFNGSGNEVTQNIIDFNEFMTASVISDSVTLEGEYGRVLTFDKNFIDDNEGIQISFFIGNNANKINISVSEGIYVDSYNKKINPAFNLDVVKTFNKFSSDPQTFITLKSGGQVIDSLPEEIEMLIEVKSNTLSDDYGIENPIKVSGRNLIFKTINCNYSARIEVKLINNLTNELVSKYYDIVFENPCRDEYLEIGTFDQDKGVYYIQAGINKNTITEMVFNDVLEEIEDDISLFSINFENVDKEDTLLASKHMDYSSDYLIWSDDLNYDKDVKLTIQFDFTDGGKIIIEKTIRVIRNLEISLVNSIFNTSTNSSIILTDEDKYNFVNNTVDTAVLDFSNFDYDDETADYNKNSFIIGSYFEEIGNVNNNEDDEIYCIQVKPNSSLEGFIVETSITLKYMTFYKYTLSFVFPVKIIYNTSTTTIDGVVLGNTINYEDNCILEGEENKISNKSSGIILNGYLSQELENYENVLIEFKNSTTNEICDSMKYAFDYETKEIVIWSEDVETEYSVNVDFAFELKDGTIVKYSTILNVVLV